MGRDLALERAWRDRMNRQQSSGLSIRKFCEQEQLVPHQFTFWKRELRRRDEQQDRMDGRGRKTRRPKRRKQREAVNGFVPVQVTPPLPGNAPIEIVVDQPLRIAVMPGFDQQLLADVVSVLESRRC